MKYLLWAALLPAIAFAQLPDGAGKAAFTRVCTGCHELERSAAIHQDRDGWKTTVDKMLALGAKGSDQDIAATIDYLARSFPAEQMPKLDVNTARQIDFESRFTFRRSEAAAIIKWREKNGPFKSIDDFKKIPGIDASKIVAKQDGITF